MLMVECHKFACYVFCFCEQLTVEFQDGLVSTVTVHRAVLFDCSS